MTWMPKNVSNFHILSQFSYHPLMSTAAYLFSCIPWTNMYYFIPTYTLLTAQSYPVLRSMKCALHAVVVVVLFTHMRANVAAYVWGEKRGGEISKSGGKADVHVCCWMYPVFPWHAPHYLPLTCPLLPPPTNLVPCHGPAVVFPAPGQPPRASATCSALLAIDSGGWQCVAPWRTLCCWNTSSRPCRIGSLISLYLIICYWLEKLPLLYGSWMCEELTHWENFA